MPSEIVIRLTEPNYRMLIEEVFRDAGNYRIEDYVDCKTCLVDEPCLRHAADVAQSERYDGLLREIRRQQAAGDTA